jgi:membrane protein YqaA with SNARE-associated domain
LTSLLRIEISKHTDYNTGMTSFTLALLSLSASGFLSATLLPGSSEAALLTYLHYFSQHWTAGLACVGVANSLGSLSSYALARLIPHKAPKLSTVAHGKTLDRIQKYGSPALILSFLPIVGDALPLAAGWLGLPLLRCAFFIALGKFARYGVLLLGYFAIV